MIVGLNGAKRSGKDLSAQLINEIYPTSIIYKFADPIKQGLYHASNKFGLGLSYDDFDGNGIDREMPQFDLNTSVCMIHEACSYLNNDIPIEYIHLVLDELRVEQFSIRQLLQYMGTDVVRSLCDSYWVDYARREYEKCLFNDPECLFIITDVRFKNELQMIRDHEHVCIHIKRDNSLKSNHVSDTELNESHFQNDMIVLNNGTVEDLRNQLINAIGKL